VIWGYLDKFGLADKVRKAKNQLNADMGNDIEFSGGERQIIAFIRILLQDRDIVIMDE
jgi:ABC-type transport system involved in cytochrome bd biosynthesis fused ATPase/permease subunit